MQTTNFAASGNHYCKFSVSPPCSDALSLRRAVEDALGQTFGVTSARIAVDILWVAEDGDEAVMRISTGDAAKLFAALAAYDGIPRMTLVKESPFLPSLLSRGSL
ncbi:hypothetical protein HDZ31DRAFT_45573 [Schizophyllum fasciatum]